MESRTAGNPLRSGLEEKVANPLPSRLLADPFQENRAHSLEMLPPTILGNSNQKRPMMYPGRVGVSSDMKPHRVPPQLQHQQGIGAALAALPEGLEPAARGVGTNRGFRHLWYLRTAASCSVRLREKKW